MNVHLRLDNVVVVRVRVFENAIKSKRVPSQIVCKCRRVPYATGERTKATIGSYLDEFESDRTGEPSEKLRNFSEVAFRPRDIVVPDECIGNEAKCVLVGSGDVGPRLNIRPGSFVDDAEVRDDLRPKLVGESGQRSATFDDGGHDERSESAQKCLSAT